MRDKFTTFFIGALLLVSGFHSVHATIVHDDLERVVNQGNQIPVANFEWWVGDNKLEVDALSSSDLDGEIVEYRWYVNGHLMENSLDWEGWTWERPTAGVYEIVLVVVDDLGAESEPVSSTVEIEETLNSRPEAIFSWHLEGSTLVVDGSGSSDDIGIVEYRWVVNGEEDEDLYGLASWEWENVEAGSYDITLHVFDAMGEEDVYRNVVDIKYGFKIPGFPLLGILSGVVLGILVLRRMGLSRNGIPSIPV